MSDTAMLDKRVTTDNQPERTRAGRTYVPVVDILEKPDELMLLAEVPGARAEDIDINYERGQLTISATVKPRHPDDAVYLVREYGIGDFARSFQIGEGIDSEKIAAEVRDGVLTLHLPKAAAARSRKIAVKQ